MGTEIGPVRKGFTAVSTAIRLFSRVGSHVTLEEPWSGEGFPTDVAFVMEVVSENVHG